MMTVRILLFAQLSEAIGSKSIDLDLPERATVGELLHSLSKEHPSIAALDHAIAVAIDERYVARDTVIHPGQMIALIPPVSGG
jgi:molybdopterin converting factor subunit 1